jgi:two-component system sensor histidine kinase BaeS
VEAEVVAIQVKDTGEGIAPHDLPHVWERFYQAESARTGMGGGSGLGLALVKEWVEAMGGTVSVESVPGEGSCFSIRFPLMQQAKLVESEV